MKITAMVTITVLAGITPHNAAAKSVPMRRVAVCVENLGTINPAWMTTSRLFQRIGIAIDWAKASSCPANGIRISFGRDTLDTSHPGALAYALPFEGSSIHVFLDRIEKASPSLVPHLLGYVMAHEITHIMEGTNHHSAHGVMKAHWEGSDFNRMLWDQLGFDQEDLDLIRRGLDSSTRFAGLWRNPSASR